MTKKELLERIEKLEAQLDYDGTISRRIIDKSDKIDAIVEYLGCELKEEAFLRETLFSFFSGLPQTVAKKRYKLVKKNK